MRILTSSLTSRIHSSYQQTFKQLTTCWDIPTILLGNPFQFPTNCHTINQLLGHTYYTAREFPNQIQIISDKNRSVCMGLNTQSTPTAQPQPPSIVFSSRGPTPPTPSSWVPSCPPIPPCQHPLHGDIVLH